MKKFIFGLLFSVVALCSPSAFASDVIIKKHELPKTSQTFIDTYFKDKQISYVMMDKGMITNDYKVKFLDNVEIEFDHHGEWEEVDGNKTEIPTGFIEPKILQYVQQNFTGAYINKIEKSYSSFEVKLSNSLELVFSKAGEFEKIDD